MKKELLYLHINRKTEGFFTVFFFNQILSCKKVAYFCMLLLFLASPVWCEPQDVRQNNEKIWGFGQSVDRGNAIWHKGKNGSSLNSHQQKTKKDDSINTRASIEQALKEAEKRVNVKGKLGISVEENSSSWTVKPDEKNSKIDEKISRERRHVVRAFAGVEKGEDFSISFGPEIILKDEEHSAESAISDQPDSALGLGMKFKYDF